MLATLSCGGSQQRPGNRAIAANCQITHSLTGNDEIQERVDRLSDGWLLSMRMSVRLTPGAAPIEIRGLGRVTRENDQMRCMVVEASGVPGAPRFDTALCLDSVESIADLLSDAEESARPGETVVQEVRLRTSRRSRRSARSSVGPRITGFQEHAEVARDPDGRVIRLARTADANTREEIRVAYPAGEQGRCLPPSAD